jgi:hypothetical protein
VKVGYGGAEEGAAVRLRKSRRRETARKGSGQISNFNAMKSRFGTPLIPCF